MRQLNHDVRISYIDTSQVDQSMQNFFVHNLTVEDPGLFTSGIINLTGDETFTANGINYLYVTSDVEFRIVINGNEEIICRHLSTINFKTAFNILFENIECSGIVPVTNIKYLHGKK